MVHKHIIKYLLKENNRMHRFIQKKWKHFANKMQVMLRSLIKGNDSIINARIAVLFIDEMLEGQAVIKQS